MLRRTTEIQLGDIAKNNDMKESYNYDKTQRITTLLIDPKTNPQLQQHIDEMSTAFAFIKKDNTIKRLKRKFKNMIAAGGLTKSKKYIRIASQYQNWTQGCTCRQGCGTSTRNKHQKDFYQSDSILVQLNPRRVDTIGNQIITRYHCYCLLRVFQK